MDSKICGIKDNKTLKFIIDHRHYPKFIGFITNYPKSKRYLKLHKLKNLISTEKKKCLFVSVLVKPDLSLLERIKNFNFDYYQLYNVNPWKTKMIKRRYKKKIITAITVKTSRDVLKYKKYKEISDIILFDSKGYEKTLGFNHNLVKNLPKNIVKMIAGNIKYNDKLDKISKIADIVDVSGNLETADKKDIIKIDTFLKNISKL